MMQMFTMLQRGCVTSSQLYVQPRPQPFIGIQNGRKRTNSSCRVSNILEFSVHSKWRQACDRVKLWDVMRCLKERPKKRPLAKLKRTA